MLRIALIVPLLIAVCASAIHAQDAQPLPPDSEYVIPKDGDLFLNGQRIRFWGGIGGFPPQGMKGDDPKASIAAALDRYQAYGFNMHRIWGYDGTIRGQNGRYTKGDNSKLDIYDATIAEAKKRGYHLWVGSAGKFLNPKPQDAGIIDDPATAEAWAEAVKNADEKGKRQFHVAAAWDARFEAIIARNTTEFLSHTNQYTGLRVGDDPVFAIWELNNEQWWIVHMVSGHWQQLPAHFQQTLMERWHAYLKGKYGTDEKLREAWMGLLPNESIEKGTILLAPLRGQAPAAALNDANPLATAKFEGEPTEYGRDDFAPGRGRDVNEFFAGLLLAHKQRLAAAFKTNGKAARLTTLLHDTGIGYNGIAQLMHQNADAVSHCAYIGGWTNDTQHKRYPWYSGLEEYPSICMGVPWLEHNTVEGKPYFVYETQIGAPAKYRAEFPYRLVFLAATNDWDAVCWHTMSGGYDWSGKKSDDPLVSTLAFPGHAAYQFTYLYDEVQLSAMALAGHLFRSGQLKPAPSPTKFIYGAKTLYDPESMSYAGSYGKNGLDMRHTTYRYGSRIQIDPTRQDDEVQGPTVRMNGWIYPNPLQPTDQMTYNHKDGWLTFSAPGGAAFTGFLGKELGNTLTFSNGVTISDVKLKSDPGMNYPVTDEEMYVSIGVASTDGKPLDECASAIVSAVSTSHNTGLEVIADPDFKGTPGHAWQGMKITSRGTTPVLFTRVGCTITSKAIAGMTYTMRDWHWKVIQEGKIGPDGALAISADQPVFIIELKR